MWSAVDTGQWVLGMCVPSSKYVTALQKYKIDNTNRIKQISSMQLLYNVVTDDILLILAPPAATSDSTAVVYPVLEDTTVLQLYNCRVQLYCL